MANLGAETGGAANVRQLTDNNPNGTSFGQSVSDLISFYNATPVAQQASSVDLLTQLVALGLIASGTTIQSKGAPPNITAAGALSASVNGGRFSTVNSAAGIALTLPAATGSGTSYDLFIGTTVTSIGTTVTAAGSDKISGQANQTGAAGAPTAFYIAAGTTVTLNGTTKGGIKGDIIRFVDVSAALWSVNVISSITGTAATPFT